MPAHLMPVSRRQFVVGAAAAIGGLATPQLLAVDDSQTDLDCWAVLSDTHLVSAKSIEKHYQRNKVAMEKRSKVVSDNFDIAAAQLKKLNKKPAGVVLNGDCVHVGGEEEYGLLAKKFGMLKEFPIHVTMGNHDHRSNFIDAFRKPLERDQVLLEKRHVSVLKSRHANLVLLDSLTMKTPDRPVKGPGILGKQQLEWLESVLDANSDKPAIIVFHHNITPSEKLGKQSGVQNVVVKSASPFKGLAGGLEDTDVLLKMLMAKPHVKAVVTGHMHQFRVFKYRKIHFVSLPSVGYTFDPKEPVGWVRLQLSQGAAEVELQTLDPTHNRHHHRANLKWS